MRWDEWAVFGDPWGLVLRGCAVRDDAKPACTSGMQEMGRHGQARPAPAKPACAYQHPPCLDRAMVGAPPLPCCWLRCRPSPAARLPPDASQTAAAVERPPLPSLLLVPPPLPPPARRRVARRAAGRRWRRLQGRSMRGCWRCCSATGAPRGSQLSTATWRDRVAGSTLGVRSSSPLLWFLGSIGIAGPGAEAPQPSSNRVLPMLGVLGLGCRLGRQFGAQTASQSHQALFTEQKGRWAGDRLAATARQAGQTAAGPV